MCAQYLTVQKLKQITVFFLSTSDMSCKHTELTTYNGCRSKRVSVLMDYSEKLYSGHSGNSYILNRGL